MIDVGIPGEVLSGGYRMTCEADSWYGRRHLGRVPVVEGSVTWSTKSGQPGTLDLSVPRMHPETGEDLMPTTWDSLLGRWGQEIVVRVLVTSLISRQQWSVPLGRFMVTAADDDTDGVVRVTGASMMERVAENRLQTTVVPRGTLAQEVRRLVPKRISVYIDPALRDRRCPRSLSWEESRLDALGEIADAWPARLRESRTGTIQMLAPVSSDIDPAVTLTDGEGGTLVDAPRSTSRDGVYNVVIARGQETEEDGSPTIQAYAAQRTGPMRIQGPYGQVTRFWSSPLLTSKAMAQQSANTMLANSIRESLTLPVTHVPDWRLDLDDPVKVVHTTPRGVGTITHHGRVTGLTIPLTPGTQRTDVGVEW